MRQSNPFTRYAQHATELSAQYTSGKVLPLDPVFAGSRAAFIATADYLHSSIVQMLAGASAEKLGTPQVRHGMRVMARFAYYAALQAEQQQLSTAQLRSALTHQQTFGQTLEPLASNSDEVTKRVERQFGLWGESDNPTPENRFDFRDNGSLRLNAVNPHIELTKLYLVDEKGIELSPDAQCSAHRARALEPVYHAVMPLYSEHVLLGGAILNATP